MDIETTPTRQYRGVSTQERRAQRRHLLIEAGIQVYSQLGYHKATVKGVCDAAGLTERYFYESFASREELLIACFDAVSTATHEAIFQAGRSAGPTSVDRAQAMLYTFFAFLQQQPLSARVFLVEIQGVSPEVDQAFAAALLALRQGAIPLLSLSGVPQNPLLEAGVHGGLIQIALQWVAQGYEPPIEEVTKTALHLVSVLWC